MELSGENNISYNRFNDKKCYRTPATYLFSDKRDFIRVTTFEHISKALHIHRECSTATRLEEEGGDVIECNPTSKTVCVAKTRYEPEEYLDDECTTTTKEECKTNYVRT